jgi:MFS family permease
MAITEDVLDQAIDRARRRLVPFLLLMYVVSFLDRANIGFAKQAFQASTGISEAAYALGAGLFFLTYALLEVPSNLIMRRVGVKIWMSRIMVTWGLVSAATMFATSRTSFYLVRLLLGAAEAGFFPGVILYLTYWFPNRVRCRVLGLFYFGAPLASILGGPVSGLLLELNGRTGLQGWQWMFLVEGLLSVAVGVWAYFYLDNNPDDARWFIPTEKKALLTQLSLEEHERCAHGPSAFLPVLTNLRVLHFAAIYFLIQMIVYGVVFYLPTEVAAILGKSVGLEVGLVSAIPWICALAAVFWLPRMGDRYNNHRLLAILILATSGCTSIMSAASEPVTALIALCLTVSGFVAVQPLFWTFPTSYLAGSAAAGGIAMVNAFGTLGGFVGPNLKAWADRRFESPIAGHYFLAGIAVLGATLMTFVGHRKTALRAEARQS